MDIRNLNKFTACGGCIAKLPQGLLKEALTNIPTFNDPNLLVGFDSSDDGAVYQISDDIAFIQTLDFFPPMVNDPYLFGQIAATNALSDIYAMGGEVKTALNIVCFPEEEDPAILGQILRGGAEKVKEAGGVLCGGHSINDSEPKYGLSVTGIVHPNKILKNNACQIGDKIILTKPLGIGMITSAYKAEAASQTSYEQAIQSMTMLNKYAMDIARKYNIHSCTDVTGFGFLGHLNEMVCSEQYSIMVKVESVPYIPEAKRLAEEFLLTSGGQKNRLFLQDKVKFEGVSMAMEEILFDPQTSGGLLIAVANEDAEALLQELSQLDTIASIVATVCPLQEKNILVL